MTTTLQSFEGSVGMGTDNPSRTLHIEGEILVEGDVEMNGDLEVSSNNTIINSNNITFANKIFGLGSGQIDHNLDLGVLMEHKDGSTYANVALIFHADEDRFSMGFTQNTLSDSHILHFQDPTHRLKVDMRGNTLVQNNFTIVNGDLGVGTETPTFKLDVHGTANTGTLTTTAVTTTGDLEVGNSNLVVNTTTSRIGIGTDTPLFNLDVHGTANVGVLTVTSISGDGSQLTGLTSNLHEVCESGNTTSNTVQFTNTITGFVTTSNIVVSGNVTATSFLGDGSQITGISSGGGFTTGGGNAYHTSGDVGIGTNNPVRALDVRGDINIEGNVFSSNAFSIKITNQSIWEQIGSTFNGGDINTRLGEAVSISGDGSVIAVGGGYEPGPFPSKGQVKVYVRTGGTWTQRGSNLDGHSVIEYFGQSASISDNGLRLVVGALGYGSYGSGNLSGRVYVYDWNGTAWSETVVDTGAIGGSGVYTFGDGLGRTVTISGDGNTIAAASPYNDDAGDDFGKVSVYRYSSGTWSQLGSSINGTGDSTATFGYSLSLSQNGSIVSIGTYEQSLTNPTVGRAGEVKVYEYSGGSWSQIGATFEGSASFEYLGIAASLSADGTKIAIGAYGYSSHDGRVNVWEYNSGTTSWSQIGSDILGGSTSYLGTGVSLSGDGTHLVLTENNKDATNYSGAVKVYQYTGGSWSQVGSTLNNTDPTFVSISNDGKTFIVGSGKNGPFDVTGYAKVYEYVNKVNRQIKDQILEVGTANLYVDTTTGNVGIGTDTPLTKLHVVGSAGAIDGSGNRKHFKYDAALSSDTSTVGAHGIYANSDIVTQKRIMSAFGTLTASDERIKTNIDDVGAWVSALDTLRLLKPKQYTYKDVVNRGEQPVWGFIAQEVRDTLPYATKLRTEYVPDMYTLAKVSDKNKILYGTSKLNSGEKIKIITPDGEDVYTTIIEIIDNTTFRIDTDMKHKDIFLFGREVEDFTFLNKDSIFTITTAALQEIDTQLQNEKQRKENLKTRLKKLEEMF
jgi:hypothetical protein